jgi:hypothetical protein
MFLMEERIAPEGSSRVMIYMRSDGLFEGRLYRRASENNGDANEKWSESFVVCALTETLFRARAIVHEELGCSADTCETCRMP